MQRNRTYIFTLREQYPIDIAPVIVQADIEELFRRTTNLRQVVPAR